MIFLFTKSKKIGSKLIRWGLDEPVSHFAPVHAMCPKRMKGIVFHSNFSGFGLDWLQGYLREVDVVLALQPKQLDRKESRKISNQIINNLWGKEYDKPAFAYFTYRAARRKLFGTPLPTRNEWDTSDILCTGVANQLHKVKPEWFSDPIIDGDIMTPWQLANNMMGSGAFWTLDNEYLLPIIGEKSNGAMGTN